MCDKFLIKNAILTDQKTFYMKKTSLGLMKYIPNYVDPWREMIEILGIFNDRVWNKEIFSDALENSKDSNVPFGVKNLLFRRD